MRRVVFQPLLLQDGEQLSKPVLLLRGQRGQDGCFLAAVLTQHLRLVLRDLPAEGKLFDKRMQTV